MGRELLQGQLMTIARLAQLLRKEMRHGTVRCGTNGAVAHLKWFRYRGSNNSNPLCNNSDHVLVVGLRNSGMHSS